MISFSDKNTGLIESLKTYNEACFAMLHAAAWIRNTELEGASPFIAINFLDTLLEKTLANNASFSLGLTTEEINRVNHAMKDLVFINQQLFLYQESDLQPLVKKITATIIQRAEQNGICYFPSGWCGEKTGHFAGVKFRDLGKGRFACSIINQGSGMRYHRPLVLEGENIKYDYQSAEYCIDLTSEMGKYFVKSLIQLQLDRRPYDSEGQIVGHEKEKPLKLPAANRTITHYAAEDLYGLLVCCSESVLEYPATLSRAAAPHITGTCAITNALAVLKDAVNTTDVQKIIRFNFAMKLTSLQEGLEAYKSEDISATILRWALHEFFVRIHEHYPKILTQTEMESCLQLGLAIQQQLDEDYNQKLREKCQEQPLPPSAGKFRETELSSVATPVSNEQPINTPESRSIKPAFNTRLCAVEQMLEYLQEASEYFKGEISVAELVMLRGFMHSLPSPSGDARDDYWDRIPIEQLTEILHQFTLLLDYQSNIQAPANIYQFEIALMAYDIAAQIAPRIPELKLADEFCLGLEDGFTKKFSFFDPLVFHTIKTISHHFQKRNENKKSLFSNNINLNSADKTQEYILERLVLERRQALINQLKDLNALKPEINDVADHQLLDCILTRSCVDQTKKSQEFRLEGVLPDSFSHLFTLAATAHNLGIKKSAYTQNDGIYSFQDDHFQQEMRLKQAFKSATNKTTTALQKHFPRLPITTQTTHYDFAENLIFHPADELEKLREEYEQLQWDKKDKKQERLPYEIMATGSFVPGASKFFDDIKLLDETFKSMESSPSLHALRVLAWAQNMPEHLVQYNIQQLIFNSLFSYGKINFALREMPNETITLIRTFLQKSIEFYQHRDFIYLSSYNPKLENYENFKTLIWLFQVQYHLYCNIKVAAAIYSIDISHEMFFDTQRILQDTLESIPYLNQKHALAKQIILMLSLKENKSQKDYEVLTLCYVLYYIEVKHYTHQFLNWGVHQAIPNEINYVIENFRLQEQANITNFLKSLSKDKLNELMNGIVHSMFMTENSVDWNIIEECICSIDGAYSLDLINCQLQKNQQIISDVTTDFLSDDTIRLINEQIAPISLIKRDATHLESSDGEWTFEVYLPRNDISKAWRNLDIEGVRQPFLLLHRHLSPVSFFKEHHIQNPFEQFNPNESNYIYYAIENPMVTVVVELSNNKNLGYLYTSDSGWIHLVKEGQQWKRTNNFLLELVNPLTDFTQCWADYFKKKVGLSSIKINAIATNAVSCQIGSIEIEKLNLTFSYQEQQWHCVQFPGFYLSLKQSLPQLHGYAGIIILVNQLGEEKIIIPKFKLKRANGNQALVTENFVDQEHFLFSPYDSENYFLYSINSEGELLSTDLFANFYLILLYRNLSDYDQAIRALKHTEVPYNNDNHLKCLVDELEHWQNQTPLGAALDCKIACRMLRHTEKWSKHKYEWRRDQYSKSTFEKFVSEQFAFYQLTFFHTKLGLSIIPEELQLTDEELTFMISMTGAKDLTQEQCYNPLFHREYDFTHNFGNLFRYRYVPEKHLDIFEQARFEDQERPKLFEKDLESSFKLFIPERHHRQPNAYQPFIRMFYDHTDPRFSSVLTNENQYGHPSRRPGLNFLLTYFVNLFDDARSGDFERRQIVKATLYSLIQNDSSSGEIVVFIRFLVLVFENPKLFNAINPVPNSSLDCFRAVARHSFKLTSEGKIKAEVNLLQLKKQAVKLVNAVNSQNLLLLAQENNYHLQFQIKDIIVEPEFLHPLANFVGKYFHKVSKPLAEGEFPLDDSDFRETNPLAHNLMQRYRAGHELNKKNHKIQYQWLAGCLLSELENELKQSLIDDRRLLANLATQCLELANSTATASETTADLELKTLQKSSQLALQQSPIILEDLLFALLHHDVTTLARKNIFLTQESLNEVLSKIVEYALVHSRVHQIEEALSLIREHGSAITAEVYLQQKLGILLDRTRSYSIQDYPECLVYETRTQRMIRDDQVDVLIKTLRCFDDQNKLSHVLLQFPAGAGKTSTLIPILAHYFARLGKSPIIVVTNELYNVADVYENLILSTGQGLEIIDRELDHQWITEELNKLLQDLEKWKDEKKCLLIKAITWHGIHTAKKIAYGTNDRKLAASAEAVLNWLKYNSMKLEDEPQIISDPTQESIRTYGSMQSISLRQQELCWYFYEFLFGYRGTDIDLAELSGINHESKKSINNKTLTIIQESLCATLQHYPDFTHLNHSELKAYLLSQSRKRPDWLLKLNRQNPALADLLVFARSFIQTHLSHVFSLQLAKDYGKSIHYSDLTVAPKHDGKDVTSHYSDQLLLLALTIQFYGQQGIPPEYIITILDKFLSDHYRERKWNSAKTEAEAILEQQLPADCLRMDGEPFSLDKWKRDSEWTKQLSERLDVRKHPLWLKQFLFHYVLPQIRTPKFRVTSTPADFQAGFHLSIMLSATPGCVETYPVFLSPENCFLQADFEAEVINTLLKPQNETICLLEMSHTPEEFFNNFKLQYPEVFQQIHGLIDRGALLSNAVATRVIRAYLDIVTNSSALCFERERMVVLSNTPGIKEINILGTGLKAALKQQGISLEKFLLFLFLDLSKTTGTDVLRPYDDRVALSVGKGQTLTEIIQAAMRERQLLWENAQSIIWVMFRALYHDIAPDQQDRVDLKHLLKWMVVNEAEQNATKIILRAYQGIYQLLESVVWENIKTGKSRYADFANQLQKQIELSTYKLYELESALYESDRVLNDYVNELCQYFKFNRATLDVTRTEQISRIIKETARLIKKMRQPHGAELNAEVCQIETTQVEATETAEQEQTQKMKSKFDTMLQFKFALEEYESPFFYSFLSINFPIELAGCYGIRLPKLYINRKNFSPFEGSGSLVNAEPIKPIMMLLLIIKEDKPKQFFALTSAGAEVAVNAILAGESDPNTAYVIMSLEVQILFASSNLSATQKNDLKSARDVMQMLTFAAFLNGQISNPVVLSQIIRDYGWIIENYKKLTDAITRIHVSHQPVRLSESWQIQQLFAHSDKVRFFNSTPARTSDPAASDFAQLTLASQPINDAWISAVNLDQKPSSILPRVMLGFEPSPAVPRTSIVAVDSNEVSNMRSGFSN